MCGPWSNGDVGAVAAAGSMTQVSGVFTVSGSGDDIHSLYGNPMDEFHFVYQQVTGDATIVARVNSVQNTNEWAKAGVMFRSALDTGAAFAFILARPDRQVQAQFRATAATTGTDSGTQTGGTTAAKWLKIERVGNTFRTSYSTDGSSYTQIGTTTTVTMGATAYVGLAVTSHVDGTLCAAQFDNVSVTTVSVCNNNGTCNAGENCSNCAADCGACGQLGLDTRPSNTTCLAPAPLAASYALQDKWELRLHQPGAGGAAAGRQHAPHRGAAGGLGAQRPHGATSSSQTSAFLTLSNVVTSSNGGFLSMAFHPSWATNRYAYVVYTTANRMKRLSRFQSTDGGQTLNASTEQVVLQIQHLVEFNHNGGQIAFGGDGYLYMSTGDDAYQDYARARQAANTNNLFGKVLRIDVNSGSPYAIPLDNPFAAIGGGAPEVYAYGFRNPWRFSVDRLTGDIWVADVGENTWGRGQRPAERRVLRPALLRRRTAASRTAARSPSTAARPFRPTP